jgi:hypothetical protein
MHLLFNMHESGPQGNVRRSRVDEIRRFETIVRHSHPIVSQIIGQGVGVGVVTLEVR